MSKQTKWKQLDEIKMTRRKLKKSHDETLEADSAGSRHTQTMTTCGQKSSEWQEQWNLLSNVVENKSKKILRNTDNLHF